MFWLGLILAICYVPGYTGASVPTQWAVLSILLPACLWRVSTYNIGHKLFFLFAVYAFTSVLWSVNPYAWVWGMWLVFIWGLSFHLGSMTPNLRGLWKGLAVGLYVSVAIAIAQALDYAPVEANDPYLPAGLFFNSTLLGMTLGLVFVALAAHRLWWYMPPLALGLILSGSRGGFFLVGLGLLARFTQPALAIGVFACAGIGFLSVVDLADTQRLTIWAHTIRIIFPFGQGAGSFVDVHYIDLVKQIIIRPEFVHNDILQLAYEYGIGAVPFLAIPALALAAIRSPEWPVVFVWCIASLFYFPLYAPLTAFIGLVVAGHCLRDWHVAWSDLYRWRSLFLSRPATIGPGDDFAGHGTIPLVARTAHTEA